MPKQLEAAVFHEVILVPDPKKIYFPWLKAFVQQHPQTAAALAYVSKLHLIWKTKGVVAGKS